MSLFVFSLSLAIIVIDSTVLNVSISILIRDLNTDIIGIQWIIAVYSLTMAALMITGGRLGDLYGRKKMFMLGAVIFAIGSAITSFSTSAGMLLFGWSIVEGIGAALMMPAASSLLISTFITKKERAIAFGVFGGIAAAASAFGPIFGGYLTTNYSWNWAFRINVVIVLILLALSFVIHESRDTKEKKQIDWLGVLLSSISIFLIVFGIVKANTYGWFTAKEIFTLGALTINLGNISIVPVSIVIGILLFAFFIIWQVHQERNGKTPLVSIKLFENRQFNAGVTMTSVLSLSQAGIMFAIPVFLQAIRHLNAYDTGIALLPLSLSILFAAPLSAVLSRKLPPKLLVQFGVLLNIASAILMISVLNINTTAKDLTLSFVLMGVGMGFVLSQTNNFTLSAVETYQAGEASGVSSMLRQLSSALGAAIIGTVFIGTLTTSLDNNLSSSKLIPEQLKTVISKQIADSASSIEFAGFDSNSQNKKLPVPVQNELTTILEKSVVNANVDSLKVGLGFTIISFVASFALPMYIGGKKED